MKNRNKLATANYCRAFLYIHGFIAGAEWVMKLKHNKVKPMCIKDTNKRCNQCHECDVYVLNPNY